MTRGGLMDLGKMAMAIQEHGYEKYSESAGESQALGGKSTVSSNPGLDRAVDHLTRMSPLTPTAIRSNSSSNMQGSPPVQPLTPDTVYERLKPENSASSSVILVPLAGEPWRSGLFDCCQHPLNAIITTVAPCVTFGQIAEILDNGSTGCLTGALLYMFSFFVGNWRIGIDYRRRMRDAFQITEAPISDMTAHFVFCLCALCQEFRELDYRGLDPFRGYRGLAAGMLDGQNRPVTENTPPAKQLMTKGPTTPPRPFKSSSRGLGSEQQCPPASPGIALAFPKSIFTYEELNLATNGFSNTNLLGEGGFGLVHKGILPDGKEIAVKQMKAGSGQGEREFRAEVETISRVHHRHLVSLVGYCIAEHRHMLVYEFVPNKTLQFHFHGKGRPTMDWPTRLKIALGSAKGLSYLHEDCNPKIIHRDIKAANILLDFKFEAKVADFGLAKCILDSNTHVSTRVMGTFGYLAPEYASTGKLNEKSDVFSFGVVLLELITGRRPVDRTNTEANGSLVGWARPRLMGALKDRDFDPLVDPKLQDKFDHGEMARMVACAGACLDHSARERPRMSQIVRALEGDVSLPSRNNGIRPGQGDLYSFYVGSEDDETTRTRTA